MEGRVQYEGTNVEIDLSNFSQCSEYIKNQILPTMLGEPNTEFNYITTKVSKNDKIKDKVSSLEKNVKDNNFVIIVSYGDHIQKMVTIVEILKKNFAKDTILHQWNRLHSFEHIKPGKNELLEVRTKVPIMVTALSLADEKEAPQKLTMASNQFYRQS
ncbi:uncharacterized protein HLK63_K03839 [Nakaseomyces glabratus]|nr:ribonuclease P [Nakaseomyces glabratus]UCS22201.1 uncharacterized protein GW608_K03839 [Nakaseomyces glabratus]UCS27433.1 uncharacterized protein HLK63_K03839 [Nakaseomyces glabratus]UCS32662.1 uncharacterized protein HLK64_K03839 [Nakaseomyces glabratus]UCS37891.1 uncharacterized protein HLK62_K03839 [Nakaseomyces glabratus]